MSLKKIAEMTGVSISTVSRVLNNKEYNCASEEVKSRIWEAAKELQYVPNESARSLKMGAARKEAAPVRRFAVILERFESLDDDPFFRELYRSVEQEAFAHSCTISEVYTSHRAEHIGSGMVSYQPMQQGITLSGTQHTEKISKTPDGYIILGRSSAQMLKQLKKITRNIISINRNSTQFEIDEVICDGRAAAVCAMEYLIRKGHRHIGYIGDCSYENRYVGYCDMMIKNDLPINYANIFPTDQTTAAGYEAMKKLLLRSAQDNTVDVVLCANDATAVGALQALSEQKKKSGKSGRSEKSDKSGQCPAVISIDDIRAAQETKPALTTVHIPYEDMGKTAVKVLLDRIQKGHTEQVRVEFPSRLIIRESC
ncbi:MAG: LacI family transcriptional regulator [Clostridiales bacterium]|nr:LacI family transcriptional regulator [Clostridiales bacterium]